MSKTKKTYIVNETHLRCNGTIYAPGEKVPPGKMDQETADYLLGKGRLKTPGDDAAGESKKKDGDNDPKAALMDKNKSHTVELVKAAGYPEEEWGELNKKPLIDYYLAKQAEKSKE